MRAIFEQGSLSAYSQVRLDDSRSPILEHSQYGARRTTVFISHKHDDLDDLKGLLGFLEKQYGVKVYIDSRDPSMPKITSAQTAFNIRERIKGCDKFILLATNGAIESKWCNWELGYGDAQNLRSILRCFK
ncbi:MAG: TIR domain-containing protein [Acutalibacteraceae bacterium]